MQLSMNGLTVPPDYPATSVEHIHKKLLKFQTSDPDVYGQFIRAWIANSYRYKAIAEYDDSFRKLIASGAPSHEAVYEQERDLFGFFANAHSVFDTFCYGLFRSWLACKSHCVSTENKQRPEGCQTQFDL
jgi:hypothetical protein